MKGLSLKLSLGMLNLVLAVLLSAVYAENDHPVARQGAQGTIDITADKHTKDAVFEGNVTYKQDDVTLSCDRLILAYDEKKRSTSAESRGKQVSKEGWIKSITASGNVKITQNDRTATAGKGLYDHAKRTFTLTEGPPRFWQPSGSGMAKAITAYLDEDRFDFSELTLIIPQKEKEK